MASAPPRKPIAGDLDLDGIADPLDIDDDGDLILDAFDRGPGTSLARAESETSDGMRNVLAPAQSGSIRVFGNPLLDLELHDTVNVNAPGTTPAQIDAALPQFGGLTLGVGGIEADAGTTVELDCGDPDTGLVYCRKNNSSGKVETIRFGPFPGVSQGAPYPACCDPDGDGFGSLTRTVPPGGHPIYFVPLLHRATSAQIGTGDLVTVHATIGGVAQEFSSTLQFVFQTVPAFSSYSDGQGNAATISYPVAAPDPGTGGPGTRGNPLPVKAGGDGHVRVTLTFWKPQRPALPGEDGEWIDLGNTLYGANISDIGLACPGATYSDHPGLTLFTAPFRLAPGLLDSSLDEPASPARTLRFTLDMTECLAARGLTFDVGNTRGVNLEAVPAGSIPGGRPPTAVTRIWFKRQ